MKYAIVEISGRQFWIETGKYYDLNRIPTELGKEITLNRVLLLNNDGEILIGKTVGEGLFGISFKIKGPPDNLKTTVNPVKTLTPRFITRALESVKKKESK